MKKKRVLIYLPTIGQGGIERVVQNIIEQTHQDVTYCVTGQVQKPESILNMKSLKNKATIYEALDFEMGSEKYSLQHIIRLHRDIRNFKPDIIFSFWRQPNLITGLLLKFIPKSRRPKWVLSVHGETPGYNENASKRLWILSKLLKWCSRASDKRLTVSSSLLPKCEHYYNQKFDLYYNPAVDSKYLEAASENPEHPWLTANNNTILSIGRLDKMKDYPSLINAFEKVKSSVPDAKLLILGDGPQKPELRKQIISKGLQNDIQLVGYISNPYSYLARCKMFALTSTDGEASPMVLAESMFFSKPIVCTNFYTAPDFIEDNFNGLISTKRNHEDIAEKIISILNDEQLAKRLCENAKNMVIERHGVENACKKYLELIKEL